MAKQGEGASRSRGVGARELTVREINAAICEHVELQPLVGSTVLPEGGTSRTKLSCPPCGAWYLHETTEALLASYPDRDSVVAR